MKRILISFLFFFTLSFSTATAQTIHKDNIYFESNVHALDAQSKINLKDFIGDIASYNEHSIQIIGHTDQDGSVVFNMDLSRKRAESVKQYFLDNGISSDNIEVKFLGESDLVATSLDDESKRQNRRVSLIAEGFTYSNVAEMVTQLETNNIDNHTIDQNIETTLNLSQGTEVKIPVNAFCHLDGSPVDGDLIEMTFKEAFDYTSMVDELLFTQTEDQFLETGGMIFIEATQNGTPLRLQDGKSIDLLFPIQEQKDGMELFTGVQVSDEDGNPSEIIWEETGEEISSVEEDIEGPMIQVDLSPILDFNFDIVDTTTINYTQMLPYPKPARIAYPPYKGNYPDEEKYAEAYRKYEAVMEAHKKDKVDRPERLTAWLAEVERRKKNVYDHKRKYVGSKIYGRIKHTLAKLKEKQDDVSHDKLLNNMFVFLESSIGKVSYDDVYYLRKTFGSVLGDVKKYGETELRIINYRDSKARNFCPEFMEAYAEVKLRIVERKYEMGIIDREVVSRYAVSTTNLGWINCDRFIKLSEDEKMDLHFAATQGENQYYLVFKNIRSLIRPSKFENDKVIFSGVPKGEDVRIVALSLRENNAFLAAQDFTTGSNHNENLAYVPAEIRDMREALERI